MTKVCPHCHQEKDTSEFHRNGQKKPRIHSWCKECIRPVKRDYQREYRKTHPVDPEYHKKWWAEHREEIHERRRRQKYGDSFDYKQMATNQQGRCAICGKETVLVTDHNHKTGEVRGLLCANCNVGLGYFSDSPEILVNAATYLAANS
jgi:hypothetical protein